MTANPNFQSPEFLRLFETYTASADSIGAKMTHATAEAAPDAALIVATAADFILFPGRGRPPEVEGYRLTTRGFKELAAVSHLGPALASLVRLRELDPEGTLWRSETERLLAATVAAREANSVALWRDDIAVPASSGPRDGHREHGALRLRSHRALHRACPPPTPRPSLPPTCARTTSKPRAMPSARACR